MGVREKKKEQTRRGILRSGEKLFARKGFHGATMEEIAADASVGVGTLYNYFRSKGELLVAIMTTRTQDLLADAQQATASRSGSTEEILTGLLMEYARGWLAVDMRLMREMVSLAIAQPESLGKRMFELDELLMGQLAELIGGLQADGRVASDIEAVEAAMVLYCQFASMFLLWTQTGPPPEATIHEQILRVVRLIMREWSPRERQT